MKEIHSTPYGNQTAALVFSHGAVFFGHGIGLPGETFGEVCFNTGMSGYQEILTDPSYAGQVINFTFPHIGNVGCNEDDMESNQAYAKGLIIHEPITNPSNFRAQEHLNDWLMMQRLTGIYGVDTRAITRYIRDNGAENVGIWFGESLEDFDYDSFLEKVKQTRPMKGADLASEVSTTQSYSWKTDNGVWAAGIPAKEHNKKVIAIDFGVKHNILRCLTEVGCDVTVVPANTKAEDILKEKPDGIFLSNGPGDPAATAPKVLPELKKLIESNTPIFGICLGHQLLATALGCETEKMEKGHRGANQPVKNHISGKVEITSQNHGFVVKRDKLPKEVEEAQQSLFDQTNEGIVLKKGKVFSVQYHPEASPGPHDSYYLFQHFVEVMDA